jgi:alkylation response protein AidB-like acyl-CoA dehydrogenase
MSTPTDGLLYSADEDELRAAVRDVLADKAPWTAVLARVESDEPCDTALWRTLGAEVGCSGLLIGEEYGGAGASLLEAAVVAEELGRAVAPVPFLGSAVTATVLLATLGELGTADAELMAHRPGHTAPTDAQPTATSLAETQELLRGLASGAVTAALAVPFSTPPGAGFPASVSAHGGRLTGRVTSVADALVADVLLVPAGGALYAVDRGDAGLDAVVSLDMTRVLADLTLDAAAARLLATGAAAETALRRALTAGAAVLASEQLGLAEQCLATTVEYVKTRHQFGRAVGSYQGLKHRLAQLWVQVTQARAVARYAAARAAGDDAEAAIAVAVAQAHCSTVAVLAAEECVQMHGGIGFTWEHPAHLYLKRAKSSALAHGGAAHHRAALGALVGLPAAGVGSGENLVLFEG